MMYDLVCHNIHATAIGSRRYTADSANTVQATTGRKNHQMYKVVQYAQYAEFHTSPPPQIDISVCKNGLLSTKPKLQQHNNNGRIVFCSLDEIRHFLPGPEKI